MRSRTAVEAMREWRTDYEVYSSLVVGYGVAVGTEVSLFVTPIGQPIPRLGTVLGSLFPAHTPLTTNLWQAGALGSSLGDYAAKSLRLDFIGAALADVQPLLESANYSLRIAGRERYAGGLRDLPKHFDDVILIARHDTIQMLISVDKPFGVEVPFLLRAVLSGAMARDIR